MRPVARATQLLRQTEEKLRVLVSEAANSGDYSSVLTLAAWARTVNELTNPTSRVERPERQSAAKARKISMPSPRTLSSHNRNGYPRFLRRGNELVRVAWSKREKKEYRHKVPYSILKLLTNAMADKGRDGRVFSTEEILPLHESNDAGPVPNYQAYVGISLMKQTGLIDQHGRQGYSIPQIAEFGNAVEAIWTKLPEE
jgi:hypothetical protein